MDNLNHIGLDKKEAGLLAKDLNHLLAQYQIFYMNVRGFHWNIQGEKFFELHAQFELLYTDLQIKIDEIAERILTLGHVPSHSFKTYLADAEVKPAENIHAWRPAVESVLSAFKTIILLQRGILEKSAEIGDEGSNALMSGYISEQEKSVWMYSALVK